MKALAGGMLLLMCVACSDPNFRQADNKVLFDNDGCAYHVMPGGGDISFVGRLPDSDKVTCKGVPSESD